MNILERTMSHSALLHQNNVSDILDLVSFKSFVLLFNFKEKLHFFNEIQQKLQALQSSIKLTKIYDMLFGIIRELCFIEVNSESKCG